MTAGTGVFNLIAFRSGGSVKDSSGISPVNDQYSVDMNAGAVENTLDAAQIAFRFLPDRSDKEDVSFRLDTGVHQHTDHLQHAGESSGRIRNTGRKKFSALAAHRGVRALREAVVHMRCHGANRTVRLNAFETGDNIPNRINLRLKTVASNFLRD